TNPSFWIKAAQLVLSISFLVVIHEFGHFLCARLCGVRVEKFYMFFNPKFSLVRFKRFDGIWHIAFFAPNTTENDEWSKHLETTEWGIGWLPFGGYCAIAGMVDETHDASKLAAQAQPWEFRSKNVWQRLLIIAGGILVNFVAALMIFGLVFFHWGETTLPLKNVTNGLYFSEVFTQEGFEQQDRIVSIDGVEPQQLSDVFRSLIVEGKRNVIVARSTLNSQLSTTLHSTLYTLHYDSLTMSSTLGTNLLAAQSDFARQERAHHRRDKQYKERPFVAISEYFPMVVASVQEGQTGSYLGLQAGDSITAICGVTTPSFYEVQNELKKHPCETISVAFVRDGQSLSAEAFMGDQCLLGIQYKQKFDFFDYQTTHYGFFESMKRGIVHGWETLVMYVKQFRLVFTKEGAQSLGGFGAIGNMFAGLWDWESFWYMTAFLSLILAFMNFLPIPALDGGYILFLLVEMVTGKQPSDKFLEKANSIGMWILLALLIFA
ncbi:MAG: site-2 protease family protein, partial [Paludibacteraceae bacterium]|nr:site-2 protease family protein [Paludibacteraceae bacterium]